jgi:hypothetical protein
VFDLLIALAQLKIFGLRGGVMLEDEALESRYIIRQCVDIEHGSIIPAASERCAGLAYIYRPSCSSSAGISSSTPRALAPLYVARVG